MWLCINTDIPTDFPTRIPDSNSPGRKCLGYIVCDVNRHMLTWTLLTLSVNFYRPTFHSPRNSISPKVLKFHGTIWYIKICLTYSSVQFSCSAVSNSFRPHELQHARPHYPSPTPRVHSNSCPVSQWCQPAISSSVIPFSCPTIPPSISLFQWVNSSHEVAKVLEFQFSISPSKEHPGLISFRMDWSDVLAVQGTLKSLLQHHSSKASIVWHSAFFTTSILQRSAFFTVQLSHPYMTTGKTIALTRQSFVGKVMSLCFWICYLGWS